MSKHFFPGMPRPTAGRMIFNIFLMLAVPFIGLWLGGTTGLLMGMLVACICWIWFFLIIWFFFIHGRHGMRCEVCGRPVTNLGRGTPLADTLNTFTLISLKGMRYGYEGPGDECRRCGRIYCTNCVR